MENEMIIRRATVDQFLKPMQVLEATKCKLYVKEEVVETMLGGDSGEVFFFNLGRWINHGDLDREYIARGLVPCDPYILAKINQDDPVFASKYPNCTYWGNRFISFKSLKKERIVNVLCGISDWQGSWWFAGVCK